MVGAVLSCCPSLCQYQQHTGVASKWREITFCAQTDKPIGHSFVHKPIGHSFVHKPQVHPCTHSYGIFGLGMVPPCLHVHPYAAMCFMDQADFPGDQSSICRTGSVGQHTCTCTPWPVIGCEGWGQWGAGLECQ